MDVRFREKNGRAADVTGMTEFDPTADIAASQRAHLAAMLRCLIQIPVFGRLQQRRLVGQPRLALAHC